VSLIPVPSFDVLYVNEEPFSRHETICDETSISRMSLHRI